MTGYSQRLPKLATDLARAVAAFEPDPTRFEFVREMLERGLRNRRQERPLWHAQNAVTRALSEKSYHYESALAFATSDACTPEAVHVHMRQIVHANFLEVLVHGNLLPADATELLAETRQIIGGEPLPADCAPPPTFKMLPAQHELSTPQPAVASDPEYYSAAGGAGLPYRMRGVAANADETNCAIEVFYQFGELEMRDEALLVTLAQIASKAAFHRLRTELQLGYVVQCGVRSVNRCRGLSVLIQSAVAAPPALEGHIEEWLTAFRAEALSALDEASFAEYTNAVARNLDEPPKTLHQEAGALWPEILDATYRWNYSRDLAAEVRSLTIAELLATFDERVAADGRGRRKLASHFFSQKEDAAAAEPEASTCEAS